jgi:hypothetical protein
MEYIESLALQSVAKENQQNCSNLQICTVTPASKNEKSFTPVI